MLLFQCNRSHTVADVGAAVEALSAAGISNWSADLLSGLPQQDTGHWARTLDEVLRQFAPPHLSVYGLQIEENTRFKRMLDKGTLALPTEAQAVEMYGTFRLNFHRFDRFELDLRGRIHVRGAAFSCLRLKSAEIVLL